MSGNDELTAIIARPDIQARLERVFSEAEEKGLNPQTLIKRFEQLLGDTPEMVRLNQICDEAQAEARGDFRDAMKLFLDKVAADDDLFGYCVEAVMRVFFFVGGTAQAQDFAGTPLTGYIKVALRQATYRILEDGTYFGEVPQLPGAWASCDTLEACRDELREVVEGWLLVGLRRGSALPSIDGLTLDVAAAQA